MRNIYTEFFRYFVKYIYWESDALKRKYTDDMNSISFDEFYIFTDYTQ